MSFGRPTYLLPTKAQVLAAVEQGSRPGTSRVLTVEQFLDQLADRALVTSTASASAQRLLAGEALARSRPGFPLPEEPVAIVSLARGVDRAIGEIRRAGATSTDLRGAETEAGELLANILDDVDRSLAIASLHDARGLPALLARAVVDRPDLVDERALTVGGVAGLEEAEVTLFEALHAAIRERGGEGVTVELLRTDGPLAAALEEAVAPLADRLERRWASLEDPPEIAWRELEGGAPSLVITARDLDGEARAVVARVVDAVASGVDASRIAIAVPDLDEARLSSLRALLLEAGLPFTEPRGRLASSLPEARIALTILAMIEGPVTRDQVVELLRAPGVDASAWTGASVGHDASDRAVALAHRLRDVPVEIDRTGALLALGLTSATQDRVDDAWMPDALARMLADIRGVAPVAPRAALALHLLDRVDALGLGRPSPAEVRAALGSSPAEALARRALGEGSAAVRAVREALSGIVRGAEAAGVGGLPVSSGRLAAELAAELEETGIGIGLHGSGVRVDLPSALVGVDLDLLAVTGLTSGAYAGRAPGFSLLDERTRRALPPGSRPFGSRDRERRARGELVRAMAGSARVMLSHTTDEGGIDLVHDLVRWALAAGAPRVKEPMSRVALGASTVSAAGDELCALANGATPPPELAARVAIEAARTAFFLDPRAPAGPHTGKVELGDDAELIAAIGGADAAHPIAVTAVERAAGCAFAGFVHRVLGARRSDEALESADPRERGVLVHRALYAAFEAAKGAVDSQALDRAREGAAAALGLDSAQSPLRREVLTTAVDDAVAVVARSLDPAERFRFFAAEQRFGPARTSREAESAWPTLALEGEAPGDPVVFVDGRIDRVDRAREGTAARVVDYKTGQPPPASEQGKRALQLPLYARAAARALGASEAEAVYIAVKQRGVILESPADLAARAAIARAADLAASTARRVVLALWSGEVAPRPVSAALCGRCDARDVCRRPAIAPLAPLEEVDS